MAKIRFDQNDPVLREFLNDFLDLPKSVTEDGVLDHFELNGVGVNPNAIELIARVDGDRPKKDDDDDFDFSYTLSPTEAGKVLDLATIYNSRLVYSLFDYDQRECSLGSVTSPTTILANMLGVSPENRLFGSVFSENSCPFEPMNQRLGPYLLSGIHYVEKMYPTDLAQKAKGVVRIVSDDGKHGGSGVITSPEGAFVTARHVLFDESGKFRESHVEIEEGKKVSMKKEDILWEDPQKDIVYMRIKGLAGHPHISTSSETLWPGDQVWLVGFPANVMETLENYRPKTFTTGFITSMEGENINTSAKAAPGNSGGAMINQRGEVIGIVVSCMLSGVNTVIGDPDYSTALKIFPLPTAPPTPKVAIK